MVLLDLKKKTHSICLNAFELPYLCMVAERRNCIKAPYNVPNKKCDHQSDFSVNLHGVMGEYAAAKYLELQIDHSLALEGDDKVSDLRVKDKTIQVKTSMGRRDHPHLFFNQIELFKADYALLAVVKSATEITLAGWITKDEFVEKCFKQNFGYGDRICVRYQDLKPMEELRKIVRSMEE